MAINFILYLIAGAVAGLAAGLLGVGGGFIIVAVCLLLLPSSGVPPEHLMHVAVGTSLATICVTSLSSMLAHQLKGGVDWSRVRRMSPGIVIGALVSGVVADQISSRSLSIIFGISGLVMAFQIWQSRQPDALKQAPGLINTSLVSAAIGMASGLVGIGGGSLIVPYLHYLGEKMTRCVGTAAACGLPIALAGSLSFAWMGSDALMPEMSLGYIYLPAFFGIIVTSMLTAPLGAKLAHKLPSKQLKRIFAVFLLLVSIRIIFKSIG